MVTGKVVTISSSTGVVWQSEPSKIQLQTRCAGKIEMTRDGKIQVDRTPLVSGG